MSKSFDDFENSIAHLNVNFVHDLKLNIGILM